MSAQWDRLVESDGFQRLPPDERARVRNNYFEKVLAPRIPPEKLGTALKRWDSYRPEDKRNPKAVELMGDAGYAEAPTRSRLPVPLRADLLDDVQPGEIYNDAQGRQAVIKNGQAFPMSAGFDQATAAPQTIARAQPEAPAPDPSDDALRGAFGKASPDRERTVSDNLATDAAMSLGARAAMLPADLAVGTADLAARGVRGGFRAYDALGIPGAGWVADQITPIKDQQAVQGTYMRGRRAIQDAVSRNLSLETQEQQQAVSAAMDAAADGSGSLLDMVNQAWAGASATTANPRALAVTVAETIPDLFVAGGFARAAAAPLFKKTYDLHLRAGFNPKAAALIAAKRTSAMATGAAAGSEATIAANMSADQAAAAIDDVSDEELAAVSPRFASLMPQVGAVEARRMMKSSAMDTAAQLSAGITAVAGRLTGASSQIGKIATRGIVPETVARSVPSAVARGVGAQTGEEFIQEGGDAFAQNRAAIDSGADPERDSMRGVMAQAGAGAVAGAALGGPIGAAGNIGTGEPLKPEPAKPRMSLREYMDIRSGKKKAEPPVALAPEAEPAKPVVVEGVTLTQQVDEDGTPYWTAPGVERAFTAPEEFAEWRADQKAKAEEAAVTAEIKTLLEKETPSGEISPAEVAAPSDGQPGDQTLGGARALPADEGRADGDGGADAGMPAPGMRPPVPVAEPKSKRAPALKTPPTGGVSRSKAPKPETAEDIEANERRYLMKMLRGTGIDIGERTDITREQPRTAARMAPGLFRKGGRTIDDVATDLYNAGYISETDFNDVDGGIQAARDLIYNAITKSEPVLSIEARDRWIALRNDEAMTAQDAADEVGVDPFDFGAMPDFELSSESKPDVIDYALVEQANEADEAAVEMAARQFENDDAGFMRAVQEIIDGRAEAARQADPIVGSGEASEGGARGSGQAVATGEPAASQTEVTQGPDSGAFSLEQQTEASRQKDEARVAQAEAQKQKQRQQAEMRAQSERDAADFTLTGSDRPRDVGVPAGQAEMLVDEAPRAKAAPAADAQPATEQAPTTPAKTSPGYLEDGPSVPDAKFKPGETVNARPGRTIDEAKVVRVFDREVAGMKTRVAVIERPDGKRLQVNEGELSAGRFGSPAAGETSGKQAQPAGARRPQPGESGYTLVDAMNDLMELRAQAESQGRVADARLMSSIRQQEKLVKDMEAAAAKPSDYEKVIAKAESQIQVRSRQTGQTQWVTLRNDWTEGNRKDGSKVSVRSGGMVARVMEIDPADVVDWGSTSQGTGGKTSKKADLATRKVSENTVFTEDAAAKARELLRKKLGQINTGIDPEIMQAGITLAGYHIEKGARTFAAYAKAMVEDLGDSVKPYLKSWYMGVKFDPRAADLDGMSPSSEVEAANVDAAPTETQNAPAPEEPKRSGMDLDPGEQVIFDSFVAGLKRDGFANINQARAIYNQMRTAPESANDQKRTEELMEMAVVTVAREIAGGQRAEAEKYDALVELYGKQPNLKTRTSTSVEQQAYSTPAPLAFIASRLAGITKGTKVLEPTAGNGMLLIEASPDNAVVNELNDDRADNLRALGFNPSRRDAAEGQLRHPGYPVDAVIANPPFGAVRGDNGVMKRWQFDLPNGESIATGEIDHAITFNALKAMRPDGKAVLIVGGVSRAVKGEQARADAYHTSAAKRSFYFHLYKNYNVTDHFTVAGELYQRQGAAWPVDVIVIDGAGVSNLPLPAVEAPQVYPDWASLKEKLDGNGRVVPKQEEGAGRSNSDRGGRADQQRGLPDGPGDAAGESGRALRGSASGSGSSGRGTGSRRAVGQPGQPDAGQRGRADSQQRADVGATERSETDGQGAGQRAAQGDAGSRGSAARGSGGATRSAGGNLADKPAEVAGSATQTPYTPTSKSGAIGTLVPTNMGTAVRASLKALESRVGGVDAFVAKELGYDEKSIGQYFSAEQIDSLALALNSIKNGKGFIIGDQTGIGKGRVVAGVIRWAIRNGKTPIFVTEKPTLYSDMYRDLTDIGMQDIRPIMTNAGEKVPLDEAGNVVLTTDTAKSHGAMLSRLTADGGIGDYNVVFTTYNQMQERSGKETPQRDFLRAAADGGVVIFDESHNAGGVATGGRGGDQNEEKAGRAGFARAIAGAASGVFYSSATYAKRPDVMDLYFKTDMALAVDGDIKKLPTAIQAGGVPLQQVVATMLTKAGQYIRRERTFEGVEYQTKPVPVNRAAAEKIAQMMGAVRTFDESKKSAVEQLKKDARAEAKMISESGSVGAAGAESANFTSVMHNLIDQMLLALKVQSAADEAIAALKNGEKPVITLSNTMGSFISEYAKENDLRPGDPLPLSFADMMMRYLEKSRMVSIKDAAGRRTPKRLTDEELGANARGAYRRAEKLINESGGLGDIPVSPVDYLRQRLEDAGYKTAEITGRGDAVDYSTPGAPVYRLRGTKERSISGRRNAIAGFNNGDVDMVILNQSGSTGISLHASEKFKNQQRRRMIIAQAEKNIDTHMQMLGRVHRTGQIIAPAYTQLVADIPAEKRPAAVLAKKMASLNANTTASRDSDFTAKGVVDFLNEYGDEVVAQMMEDMPELHTELGEPLKFDDKGLIREGAARKVTGRLPLLPVADQERIYGLIESGYAEALERADAMGENSLEAKTLALDAKTLSSGTLFDAKDENSPFSAGANLETVSAKRLGKPLTSAQVIDLAGKNLGVKAETIGEIERAGREAQRVLLTEVGTEMTDYTTAEIAALSSIDAEMKSIRSRQDVLQSAAAQFKSRMGQISIGAQYAVQIPDQGTIYGVVVDVKRKKGVKLPVALGSWNVTIALADGARMLTVPLSKMGSGEGKISLMPASRDGSGESVMSLFDSGQTQSREERIIATGNLLAAFSRLGKGQIVTFTRDDGELEQGILMPKSFSVDAFVSSQPVILKGSLVTRLIDAEPGAIVKSVNGEVEIRRAGSARYVISVPQSKAGGGKYFLDRGLRGIVGDFSSAGKEMRVSVDDVKLAQAVIHMEEKMGQKFGTSAYRDTALALGGEPAVSLSPGEVRERGREYDPSGMQADLFDGYSKGDARPGAQKMAVARYATEAVLTPVREVTIGTGTVNGAYDLAKASAPLARKAVENLQGILTDANGKVLSVIGNFKGDRSLASVFQFTLMGEAMGTEGATNLWLTHNHPSGVSSLSQADRRLLQLTADKFSGTKITVRGIMAIGGRDFEFVAPDGETVRGTANPPRLTQVTVPERELTRTDKLGAVISSPEVATAAARSIAGKQPGIILLNGQHEPVAFVPWAPERASRLRGTGGLDDLYEAAVRANASAALIASPEGSYTPGQETNLARALKTGAVEVNVLDVIRYTDTTSESLAGSGRLDNFGPFYSRSGQSRPATGNRNPAPEWETAQVDKLVGILSKQADATIPLRAVEAPAAMRGMSDAIESLLGRKVVFFESNNPLAPAGVYVSGGVLFVNADALQPLRHVLGHEFTHSLEGPAAELHAILKARILEMAKDGAFPAYEARLEKVYQRDGLTKLSRAKVENEFVADVMGSVMSDPKVLFDLKQRMEPNAFKRLMNRLRFWIEKMMSRLRREDMRQSQFAQRTMRDLQSVKTLVADVLQATAEGQLRPAMGDAAMEGQPMFARNGQWGQFPDAAILSPPNTANAHRDYAAAKAGDTAAAYRLARDLLTPDRVEVLRQALRGASPVIVPVLAVEAAGNNRIPLAAAEVLGDALGLDVSTDIMQAKKVSRGGSDGWHRIAVQPTFDGEVRRGADYLILDDTLAQGGTLAALKTHIEQGGGRVVLASALTGKQHSSKLAPSEQTLNQLREQYGELESWWRSELGYGFVGLTESEARYILKSGQDADGIRDRIVAARNEAGERRNPTDDRPRQGESDVTQNPPDGGFSDSGADVAFSRRGQTDPDDADGLMTETLGKETVGQKLYRNVLNRFSEVERAVKYLKGKGVAIPDERDPGSLEKTFYGRTQTRLDDLKDTTKALFKVMNKAGVSFKQASDYLYALHAEERNAAIAERNSMFPDGGSGMTNRQAKKILSDTAALPKEQRDALAEVSRVVQAINRQKLNLMREAGLISAQQYQDLTTGYQHYVPLKSVVDPEEQGQGTGNGFDQRSTVIREAYGRASRAEDPLAVALLDAQKTFVRAEKNRVGRAVYNLILETSGEQGLISGPAGDYWRVLTPEEYPKQARKVQVPVIDSKTGRPKKDTKGRIVTTEDVQYVPNMNDLYRRDEIFMARVDGNLVVMEFQNKQLARQLKNMAGEQLTGVLRGMSVATKFFGRLLTQYNPEFAVPNFIRDVQTAYLNAFGADMEDPKGFAFDVMKNLRKGAASSFKGKKDPLYREFLEAGGATGAYGLTGVDDIKAEYEKLVERQRKGISPGVVMEAGKKFIEKVERFNEVFENTTRLAIYKAARDRGLSKQESARLAKDTTVNFNQKGELQWPGALYVFFNAAMQGNIAMLKAAARSKVTQSAMAGLMIFGLLESLAEGDDEEGEPMGDAAGKWALGREFTAFLDDNTFIKVPLAYGYNVPYAMGRMLGRSIKGNASPAEAIGTSLSTFMTSFVPTDTLVPTIAEPFLSVLNNETAFDSTIYRRSFGDDTYDPIAYRDYEEKRLTGLMQMLHQLAGGDRYEPNVIKEATGFDPFSASGAEALVKGYIGPQWRLATGLVGALAAGGKAVTGNFTADDVPDLNEVPVTRRFVNERSPFFYDSRFGDITREADAARKTIESMRESRTPIGDRYTPEQVRAVNNTRLFAAYDRKLRKAIDMTPDETRKAELEARRAKLVKDSIRRYNEAFE